MEVLSGNFIWQWKCCVWLASKSPRQFMGAVLLGLFSLDVSPNGSSYIQERDFRIIQSVTSNNASASKASLSKSKSRFSHFPDCGVRQWVYVVAIVPVLQRVLQCKWSYSFPINDQRILKLLQVSEERNFSETGFDTLSWKDPFHACSKCKGRHSFFMNLCVSFGRDLLPCFVTSCILNYAFKLLRRTVAVIPLQIWLTFAFG